MTLRSRIAWALRDIARVFDRIAERVEPVALMSSAPRRRPVKPAQRPAPIANAELVTLADVITDRLLLRTRGRRGR